MVSSPPPGRTCTSACTAAASKSPPARRCARAAARTRACDDESGCQWRGAQGCPKKQEFNKQTINKQNNYITKNKQINKHRHVKIWNPGPISFWVRVERFVRYLYVCWHVQLALRLLALRLSNDFPEVLRELALRPWFCLEVAHAEKTETADTTEFNPFFVCPMFMTTIFSTFQYRMSNFHCRSELRRTALTSNTPRYLCCSMSNPLWVSLR